MPAILAPGRLRQNGLGYVVNLRSTRADPVSTNQQTNQSRFSYGAWHYVYCASHVYCVFLLIALIHCCCCCFVLFFSFKDCVLLLIQNRGFIHVYWTRRLQRQLRASWSSKFRVYPRSLSLTQSPTMALPFTVPASGCSHPTDLLSSPR